MRVQNEEWPVEFPLAEIGAATAPLMIPSYTYILSDDEKTSDDEVCLTRIQEPLNKVY